VQLKLTWKKASTKAYQAFTPENIQRAKEFWEKGLPVSVHGVQRRLFIDIDEATFTLKATNQTDVHGHVSLHVCKSRH